MPKAGRGKNLASKLKNRKRGVLFGLAIGDALGAAVEFQAPGTFEPVSDFRGGGPFGLKPGQWTDDTSMALALADSIGSGDWSLDDQARRYVDWWKTGKYSVNGRVFDIGVTTQAALRRFEETGDSRTSGDSSPEAGGNGSIMRLGPVPIAFADMFPERLHALVNRLVDSSLPTHASPQCLSACAYLGVVLAALIQGEERETVLSPDWPHLREARRLLPDIHRLVPFDPDIAEVAAGSFRQKKPPEIRGSGHVVRCLEAALWAFHDATDFREAVLRAVNLGDDADTTGAVCGQLAGAYWGEDGIPVEWRRNLAQRSELERLLLLLCPENTKSGESHKAKTPAYQAKLDKVDRGNPWLNDPGDEPEFTEEELFEMYRDMKMSPEEFANKAKGERYREWLKRNPPSDN